MTVYMKHCFYYSLRQLSVTLPQGNIHVCPNHLVISVNYEGIFSMLSMRIGGPELQRSVGQVPVISAHHSRHRHLSKTELYLSLVIEENQLSLHLWVFVSLA